MSFRKTNAKEEIEKAIKKNPKLKKEIQKSEKEWENIKSEKLNKRFGE